MASTRKIVAFDRISADGYFSAADGALDWAVPDADLDKGAAGSSATATRCCSAGARTTCSRSSGRTC